MSKRWLVGLLCLAVVTAAAWLGRSGGDAREAAGGWTEVAPGVWRTPNLPAGYALVDGESALLIDAPSDAGGLRSRGVKKIDAVLLSHHHRDTAAAAEQFLADRIPVRAPKASAAWLTPAGVRKYWKEALPLRDSHTAYLVVPAGLEGLDCSLEDGQVVDWHGWRLRVVATPGHSPDHVSFLARKGKNGPLLGFCGDALSAPGKLWSPYTTDWDHWTDAGLTPSARSLRKLAGLKPAVLLPAHGDVIAKGAAINLTRTAAAVEEVAFLKSFERYTKKRLGHAPEYRFLAREQKETAGEKPWSRISEHLFLTGNTYVLTSKDNAFLVVDPWGQRSADQVVLLRKERKLGRLEVVMFSHAHYDHYDGIYDLPGRDRFQVWTLDRVAGPLAEPLRLRAPFLDARPVRIDRRLKDGDTADWREYHFRFHHLPGQTEFTMGVETVIDGKRCYFTADNFFHQDQFSGTGGWMGLNRSWPLPYAASARKVLDAQPAWVLAEHGGAMEFSAEDFRRRVRWGQVSAAAADAICPSGNHRHDWDPSRIHVEPLVQGARPGDTLKAVLLVDNPLPARRQLNIVLEGRGFTPDQKFELDVARGASARREFSFRLTDRVPAGRQVFALHADDDGRPDPADVFLGVDVAP